MRMGPLAQCQQRRAQGRAARRQPVDGRNRRTIHDVTMNQSCFAQFSKAGRQHALADAGYGPGDLGKVSRSLEQNRNDHAGPTLAKERKHRGESLVAADRFRLLHALIAVGIVLMFLSAIALHVRRRESRMIGLLTVVVVLALVVIWGRLGPYPLT